MASELQYDCSNRKYSDNSGCIFRNSEYIDINGIWEKYQKFFTISANKYFEEVCSTVTKKKYPTEPEV
jgi:hypothetical protein